MAEAKDIVVPEDVIKDAYRWKCGFCNEKFEHKDDGLRHVRTHPDCSKNPKETLNIIKHSYPKSARLFCPVKGCVRTITGVASTKSNKNGRPFSSLFEVRRHWLRTHSTVKPFVCTTCAKAGKDFRFALKSDLKEHNLTCGLNAVVWLCATTGCDTQCRSKKALVRHCKRFSHALPNPLVGVKSKGSNGRETSALSAAESKPVDESNKTQGAASSEQPPRKILAVTGKALRAFELLNSEEEQSRRSKKSKLSSSSQAEPTATEGDVSGENDAGTKKRQKKQNSMNPEKIGRVVSGSRLLALEAALASY